MNLNRRTFFSVLAALAAVPAFVRAKVDDDEWTGSTTYGSSCEPDISVRCFVTRELYDVDGRLVLTDKTDGPYGKFCDVPVWLGRGQYKTTRFELTKTKALYARYDYVSGPHLRPLGDAS